MARLLFALLVLWVLSVPAVALAQECDCTHEVALGALTVDGTALGIGPGDVVCVEAGAHEFLRFSNMMGTAEAPIVVKNCGGQVVIDNSERGYGLTLDASEHVRITGTGDPDTFYGFVVRASREGPDYSASCIIAGGKSTDYEIDHIEAYQCGFAGVSAKTDPNCDERDLSGFVQRNTRLHHLYLHDTGGEGIYFGSTGFPSRDGTCDGQTVDLIPHSHEGVYIHDNVIEDTGWDGAQIGVSPADCYFYRNRIARVGLRMEEFQMQGLQIGGGSSCEIFDNFISSGPATGIIVLDSQSTAIYNNVIAGFLDGIYINDRDSEVSEGATYRVVHNTVSDITERGITIFGTRSVGNLFVNNLLAAAGTAPLGIGGDVDATDAGNLMLASTEEALFTAPDMDDYSLGEGSPAIDAGEAVSAADVAVDQLGAARDANPDAGAFEFGAEPPEEPLAPPGPGDNPSPGDSPDDDGKSGDLEGGNSESNGCSCRAAGVTRSGSLYSLLVMALLGTAFFARRRSRVGIVGRAT